MTTILSIALVAALLAIAILSLLLWSEKRVSRNIHQNRNEVVEALRQWELLTGNVISYDARKKHFMRNTGIPVQITRMLYRDVPVATLEYDHRPVPGNVTELRVVS